MGVVFGFALESDFTAKLGGKWRPKRSPKLKLVLHWGSSSEELPKTIHANSQSGITKNVYFQPGRSWQRWVQVFGPTVGKYTQKSLIKYDRVDGSLLHVCHQFSLKDLIRALGGFRFMPDCDHIGAKRS